MFFINWGADSKAQELGSIGQFHCGMCQKDCEFDGVVTYTVRHVYWLFRWVTNKQQLTICNECGTTYPADDESFGAGAEREAIPFLDRRGWTLGAGALASLVGVGFVASAANTNEDNEYLAQPQIGDIYEVDMAKMLEDPEQRVMYSVLRVSAVNGPEVEVELGELYYDRSKGISDDIRSGKTDNPDYYMEDRLLFGVGALQAMHEEGIISDVER